MGRRKRSFKSYMDEWDCLELIENKLVCKYCKVNLPEKQNRLQEHFASSKHNSMIKSLKNVAPLPVALFRDRNNEELEIDLVSLVVFDGLPFKSIDNGPKLRSFVSKYCPAARSLPNGRTLVDKHLHTIYEKNVTALRIMLKNTKYCLIIDESPDFKNRPIFNVLVSFYEHSTDKKRIVMLDSSILPECNSVIVASHVSAVLLRYNIEWKNCLAIVSDSAAYMKKYYKCISLMHKHIIRVPCFSHLIHLSVKKTVEEIFPTVRFFCMKFSSLLSKNRCAKKLFNFHRQKNELNDRKEIPRVYDSRWYSLYDCIQSIVELAPAIVDFLTDVNAKSFVLKFEHSINLNIPDINKLLFFMRFIHETLSVVYKFSRFIETQNETPISHMFDWMSSKYQLDKSCLILSQKDRLSTWSFDSRENILIKLNTFVDSLINNITEIIQRNINGCLPSETFLRTIRHLDQSKGVLQLHLINSSDISHFLDYNEKTSLLNEMQILSSIKDVTKNNDGNFWIKNRRLIPTYSKISLDILNIPVSSISIERSFSELKYIIRKERTSLSNAKMAMISQLYYNGEL